jgi:hypothetical protein
MNAILISGLNNMWGKILTNERHMGKKCQNSFPWGIIDSSGDNDFLIYKYSKGADKLKKGIAPGKK